MKKERKKKSFIQKPEYPGGLKALRKFIRENLKYPKSAIKDKIEGTVSCKYRINFHGKVDEVKVISSLSKDCDAEAIRLIKQFDFEFPKLPYKIKAHFYKTIRVHFRLKAIKTAKPVIPIIPKIRDSNNKSYSYVITKKSNAPKASKTTKKNNRTYTYQVTIK